MNITTTARDFEMSKAIDRFTRDHLRTALGRFDRDIVAVDVFMKDSNGPRGGVDKQALVIVRLRNRQTIALESEHENLYAAIKIGSKRVRRSVRRHIRRSQRVQKRRARQVIDDIGLPAAT